MSAAGAWHSEVLPHPPHTHAQWDPILDKAVLRRSPDCLEPRVPALRAVTHTCRASARTSQPPTQQHGPQWEQVPSKEGTWGRRGSPLCCGLRRSPGLRAAGAESRARAPRALPPLRLDGPRVQSTHARRPPGCHRERCSGTAPQGAAPQGAAATCCALSSEAQTQPRAASGPRAKAPGHG